MFPKDKQPALTQALETAFGVRDYDALEPLAAADGLSTAFVYRMMVGGRPYLMRLVKETIVGIDPAREFAYIQSAAEAGIAPRVWYASVEDRLLISDFVEMKPYPAEAAPKLAATIRRLHALPAGAPTTRSLENLDVFVQRLASSTILPQATSDELLRLYHQAAAVYPRDEREWVPSHNDLKPQNILYDGDQFWFIDWEAAFMNDRYHDLAVVANFFVNTEEEERAYLAAYFGEPANDYQRARFYLMSQLIHVFYVALFALIAARSGESWKPEERVPKFQDINRRIAAGEFDLGEAEAKRIFAHAHLNRALEQMKSQRFADAIALVGDRHAKTSSP